MKNQTPVDTGYITLHRSPVFTAIAILHSHKSMCIDQTIWTKEIRDLTVDEYLSDNVEIPVRNGRKSETVVNNFMTFK